MKLLSILLRIVAVLGAAFACYTWMDTRGKTSESMEHMKNVPGVTLQAKTAQVQGILNDKAKTESDLDKALKNLKDTKTELEEREGDLRTERERVVQLNEDVVKKNAEIKSLNGQIKGLEVTIAASTAEISDLKAEIVKIKTETEPLIADLNSQIEELNRSVASKEQDIAAAVANAEASFNAEFEKLAAKGIVSDKDVVAVVEEVYIPTGEMVAILESDFKNNLFLINKGRKIGIRENSLFQFKDKNKLVAELKVVSVADDLTVCAIVDKNIGVPEIMMADDLYELVPILTAAAEESESE